MKPNNMNIIMHIRKIQTLILILSSIITSSYSQTPDSLGLPGDNLNLYGVLYLFKESKTVEEFEKKLNTPENKVNNLDLNHDGEIDYIRVIDYGKNGLHSMVLQDPITDKESQDLAVVEVEQQGNNTAHIQIVGDEDLYGKNYIIEPQDEEKEEVVSQPVDNTNYNPSPPVVVNVWAWPSVQYMYAPSYSYWSSPWYWGYYPRWWSPWRPVRYHTYWNGMYGYRSYHRRVYANRIVASRSIYVRHRRASPIVRNNITNNVYYGPRKQGKAFNVAPKTNPRVNSGGNNAAGKQRSQINNQPKQQKAQKQPAQNETKRKQVSPLQGKTNSNQFQPKPKQQNTPNQQRQSAPKHLRSVKRQPMPRNSGGGGHQGGRAKGK